MRRQRQLDEDFERWQRSAPARLSADDRAAIRALAADLPEKYVIGQHASECLDERGIMEWQAVAGIADGVLIAERPDATPNSAVEARESLPEGTEIKAVWSYLPQSGVAKLVTVHFFDRS